MLKRRSATLFIVALFLGLGAAWTANNWLSARMATKPVTADTTPVVVAALDIPFGQKIEAAHLKTVSWPVDNLPEGSFPAAGAVEGRVANQRIFAGEPILNGKIADVGAGSTLAAIITPKKRAVTVRVNDVIGVAGFLLPGNRVDVLATRKMDRKAQTRTLLEDLKVLAVDQTASSEKDKPVVVRAVTLEMEPDQAEKLVQATEEGTVQLALRNPQDKHELPVAAESKPVTKPAKAKRSGAPGGAVTVIRGTTVDVSNVKL